LKALKSNVTYAIVTKDSNKIPKKRVKVTFKSNIKFVTSKVCQRPVNKGVNECQSSTAKRPKTTLPELRKKEVLPIFFIGRNQKGKSQNEKKR
jgi:hypothetical protein